MVAKIFLLLTLTQFVGCAYLPPVPYVIDVKQGNVVTQDMVEKLKYGMSQSQVRFVLGSPLVVDAFRNDRWDYVYSNRKGGRLVKQERLTIMFEDEKLVGIDNHMSFESPLIKSEPAPEMTPLELKQNTLPLEGEVPDLTNNIEKPDVDLMLDPVGDIENDESILQTN